ncbi:hypothetical protein Zmor_026014 [Zophobas morio]|uniref:Uncharacterized protein n=1 Tax=Zophobas morio TaxID=2755281 RepID=A0AA38HUK9_9CUCU|nr:hypothetical protein Zmor_026014 [Zophobas morio]
MPAIFVWKQTAAAVNTCRKVRCEHGNLGDKMDRFHLSLASAAPTNCLPRLEVEACKSANFESRTNVENYPTAASKHKTRTVLAANLTTRGKFKATRTCKLCEN